MNLHARSGRGIYTQTEIINKGNLHMLLRAPAQKPLLWKTQLWKAGAFILQGQHETNSHRSKKVKSVTDLEKVHKQTAHFTVTSSCFFYHLTAWHSLGGICLSTITRSNLQWLITCWSNEIFSDIRIIKRCLRYNKNNVTSKCTLNPIRFLPYKALHFWKQTLVAIIFGDLQIIPPKRTTRL